MSDSFLGRIVATRIRHEGNHMVQAASLFNQLLHHFPRTEFAAGSGANPPSLWGAHERSLGPRS